MKAEVYQYRTAFYNDALLTVLPKMGLIFSIFIKNEKNNGCGYCNCIRTSFGESVNALLISTIVEGGDFKFEFFPYYNSVVFRIIDCFERTILGVGARDDLWNEFVTALVKVQRRVKICLWRRKKTSRPDLKLISAFMTTSYAQMLPADVIHHHIIMQLFHSTTTAATQTSSGSSTAPAHVHKIDTNSYKLLQRRQPSP